MMPKKCRICLSVFKNIVAYLVFILILVTMGCKKNVSKVDNTEEIKIEEKQKEAMNKVAVLEYEIASELGEGAFWNYKTQEFYWIDIEGKKFHIYNPKTKTNKSYTMPSRIGTVVPYTNKEAVVALQNGVYKINLETEKLTLLSDVESEIKDNRFNDGKCDPLGNLWVGSMHLDQKQYAANLYKISETGETQKMLDSVTISNGIVWTSDTKTMYYIDTPTSKIKAYDFDNKTGEISNERVVVKVSDTLGYPDGMTIDENDMLWVGMWNGNAVIQFNPKTGELVSKIEVPAHNVSSCAFGGENLDELYITTARVDMSEEELKEKPLSGSIFKVKPGVKGVENTFFGKQ